MDYGDSSLVGYWPFDEGTGTIAYDYSGSNATGSWQGTLGSQWTTGRVGTYAGNFDGSTNYISMPNTAALNPSGDFTLSAWIKTSASSTMGATQGRIISKRNGAGGNAYEMYVTQGGGSTLNSYIGTPGGLVFPDTSQGVADAQWHYVVTQHSGANDVMYVDGQVFSVGGYAGSVSSTAPFYIGNASFSNLFWPGLIDDVRLYSRALSATEISALYSGGK
jgi:hypothetical protein